MRMGRPLDQPPPGAMHTMLYLVRQNGERATSALANRKNPHGTAEVHYCARTRTETVEYRPVGLIDQFWGYSECSS